MDASAWDVRQSVVAGQRFLARGLREFDERARTGAIHYLDSAANAFRVRGR